MQRNTLKLLLLSPSNLAYAQKLENTTIPNMRRLPARNGEMNCCNKLLASLSHFQLVFMCNFETLLLDAGVKVGKSAESS